jgi:hypothetical protein
MSHTGLLTMGATTAVKMMAKLSMMVQYLGGRDEDVTKCMQGN